MSVKEAIKNISSELGKDVCLVAVSKTKSDEDILQAYELGHRDFGENKVQELTGKAARLPKDIRWHFIGHLQRNKVKYIAPFVHLIHSVDSEKLLKEINKRAEHEGRSIDCLLQASIADEESKFGFAKEVLDAFMQEEKYREYKNVSIRGLMGMATNTPDRDQIRREFHFLKSQYDAWKRQIDSADFNLLSMGMTGDYDIAVEEGSNMVRIGSKIFGARNYQH